MQYLRKHAEHSSECGLPRFDTV